MAILKMGHFIANICGYFLEYFEKLGYFVSYYLVSLARSRKAKTLLKNTNDLRGSLNCHRVKSIILPKGTCHRLATPASAFNDRHKNSKG